MAEGASPGEQVVLRRSRSGGRYAKCRQCGAPAATTAANCPRSYDGPVPTRAVGPSCYGICCGSARKIHALRHSQYLHDPRFSSGDSRIASKIPLVLAPSWEHTPDFQNCFRPQKNPGRTGIIRHPRGHLSCVCPPGGKPLTRPGFASSYRQLCPTPL